MSDNKTTSRKYKLILLILFSATLMCIVPPILSVFVFKLTETLIILSGTEWVALITTLVGFYYTSNVVQKQIIKSDGSKEISTEIKKEKETI